jgi:hypothetical protein
MRWWMAIAIAVLTGFALVVLVALCYRQSKKCPPELVWACGHMGDKAALEDTWARWG